MDLRNIITKKDFKEPYILLIDILEIEDIFKIEESFKGRQIKFKKNFTDIKQEQPELYMLLGKDKASKVAKAFSGSRIYFPKLQQNCTEKIKMMIINEFDGCNYGILSQKYGYSERHIQNIVNNIHKDKRINSDENQLSLF